MTGAGHIYSEICTELTWWPTSAHGCIVMREEEIYIIYLVAAAKHNVALRILFRTDGHGFAL